MRGTDLERLASALESALADTKYALESGSGLSFSDLKEVHSLVGAFYSLNAQENREQLERDLSREIIRTGVSELPIGLVSARTADGKLVIFSAKSGGKAGARELNAARLFVRAKARQIEKATIEQEDAAILAAEAAITETAETA